MSQRTFGAVSNRGVFFPNLVIFLIQSGNQYGKAILDEGGELERRLKDTALLVRRIWGGM